MAAVETARHANPGGALAPSAAGESPRQASFCGHYGAAIRRVGTGRRWLLVLAAVVLLDAVVGATAVLILDRESATPKLAPLSSTTIGSSVCGSVEGRPIEIASLGTGTDRRVLVVGGVHGGSTVPALPGSSAVTSTPIRSKWPAGTTVDIIRCLNPDGAASGTRGNAHEIDLNRNMPTANWRDRPSSKDQSRYMLHCTGGDSVGCASASFRPPLFQDPQRSVERGTLDTLRGLRRKTDPCPGIRVRYIGP
jgi:hypothetical protein